MHALEMDELRSVLARALDAAGVPAVPIVMPTPWDIGEVTAYLFPTQPVTLVDSGMDTPAGREALVSALGASGLAPADVSRVIVTHGHTDHWGGATWLQGQAGCDVLLHPDDITITAHYSSREIARELFLPLGFDDKLLRRFIDGDFELHLPDFTPMQDGDVYRTGETSLRIEHHPGHTPGHVWVVEETTGAVFVGDNVIADHQTNAGLEIDRMQSSGRAPLLQQYNDGLRELADRDAGVLFPAHGPPIEDHHTLIERRLAKTERRTRSVLRALEAAPDVTALELGRLMYRSRVEASWEVLSDLVGRLDVLVARGQATARMGEDGAWHFRANQGGNSHA